MTASPRTPRRSTAAATEDPLSPNFDPNSLVVPQLRSLLLQHNVALPSSARKQALVDAFEHHVRPHVDALRTKRDNVTPSSRGIRVLKPTSTAGIGTPPSAMKKPGSRSSSVQSQRRVSFSAPEDSSSEDDDDDSSAHGTDDAAAAAAADTSNFSDFNPFQRGSSAEDVKPRRPTPTKPRTSASARRSDANSTSQPRRRRSSPSGRDASAAVGTRSGSSAKAVRGSLQVMRPRSWTSRGESALASEDEDVEDDGEVAKAKRSVTKLAARLSGVKPAHEELTLADKAKQLGWTTLLVATLVWWAWYVGESRLVGFCDTASSSNALLRQREADLARATAATSASDTAAAAAALHPANVSLPFFGGGGAGSNDDDDDAVQLVPLSLRPGCAACPAHAVCDQGALRSCISSEYMLSPSWLSRVPLATHVLPLSATRPRCVPDDRRLLLGVELAEEVERRLAQWKGDVQCGRERGHEEIAAAVRRGATAGTALRGVTSGWRSLLGAASTSDPAAAVLTDPEANPLHGLYEGELREALRARLVDVADGDASAAEGAHAASSWLSGSGGEAEVEDERRGGIDDEYFAQLWRLATDHLTSSGQVTRYSRRGGGGAGAESGGIAGAAKGTGTAVATRGLAGVTDDVLVARRARLDVACRLRLAAWSVWEQARLWVALATTLAAGSAYARFRWRSRRAERRKVAELVEGALSRLQEQLYLHNVDAVLHAEPYLATAQLRDHVLRAEPSASARRQLWSKVSAVVEANANVRTRQAKRGGDWLRVWEWVGVVSGDVVASRAAAAAAAAAPVSTAGWGMGGDRAAAGLDEAGGVPRSAGAHGATAREEVGTTQGWVGHEMHEVDETRGRTELHAVV